MLSPGEVDQMLIGLSEIEEMPSEEWKVCFPEAEDIIF
jgi:hypothetical protein